MAKKDSKKPLKRAPKKAAKKAKAKNVVTIDVGAHVFVPLHELLNDKEKKELLEKYSAQLEDLPKIMITDSALHKLGAKEGDIVRITRDSHTAGTSQFYRVVVSE